MLTAAEANVTVGEIRNRLHTVSGEYRESITIQRTGSEPRVLATGSKKTAPTDAKIPTDK